LHGNALNSNEGYFSKLKVKFEEALSIAKEARLKGFDPTFEPECIVTVDLAERVEKSVEMPGVASRIRELNKVMSREEMAFKVAEEMVFGRFGPKGEEAAEKAIRTALAILDEGVTVAHIQGISSVRIKSNPDKSRYLAVYFAGPIRSAGGTEMGLTLVVADFVQRLLSLGRYRATELEANRFVEEARIYEREVARFQYRVPDEELYSAVMNMPVEANGVETDKVDVAVYRNLPRVETNRVRGGALRVVNDGLIGRAQKVLKIVEKLDIPGWSWLKEIHELNEVAEEARELRYMEDVVGGRPIFSTPEMFGGFRLRYGRCRNTGLAALGVHPATMQVLRNFIATGTQLRVEKPGKAGVAMPVDTIEPPIVMLKDGSVVRVEDAETAGKVADSIDKILFLGDLLVGFGEFLENNLPLVESGFVEEWWGELLNSAVKLSKTTLGELASKTAVDFDRLNRFMSSPLSIKPKAAEAIRLSKALGIPLHPRYTYFWESLNLDELNYLRIKLEEASVDVQDGFAKRLSVKNDPGLKLIFEKLCVPHLVVDGEIVVEEDDASILFECLSLESKKPFSMKDIPTAIEAIEKLSGMRVERKSPTYIGARMGRPEKAKRREMRPNVHCLFPVGLAGGARRNIVEAADEKPTISVEIVKRRCPACREVTHRTLCQKCGERTQLEHVCPKCRRILQQDVCPVCKVPAGSYEERFVELRKMLEDAFKRVAKKRIELVKGVKGLTSEDRTPEPIEKGVLRALHDLSVFKDGTVRFDATNAPLTQFKPSEAGVSVDKLREIGYEHDVELKPLKEAEQLCALEIQDVIIPYSCAEYFVQAANFVDDMLEKLYGLPRYYNAKTAIDLIGHLVVGLSPHTSVGVIGRIVGFTKANACFAHPFWHAAKRRDCDGDEDSLSLALDMLLNFSRAFLPARIGGLMDAPLLLTLIVNPSEIARQAFNIEVVGSFSQAFFEEAKRRSDPKIVNDIVETVSHRIGGDPQFEPLGFTHNVSDINSGNHESIYKTLGSMIDKVKAQLELAEAIRGIDVSDVARRVLSTHLMRDVTGNLKAFSTQKFRCINCNTKFRRVPLKGVCTKCEGKITLTVYRGTIEKYLDVAEELVKRYGMGRYTVKDQKTYAEGYMAQRLLLLRQEINSLFTEKEAERERQKQKELGDFM